MKCLHVLMPFVTPSGQMRYVKLRTINGDPDKATAAFDARQEQFLASIRSEPFDEQRQKHHEWLRTQGEIVRGDE